ncbi:sporulation protein [Actinocorallia sp. API 0066]|uniref:sporulation protein n=1 Tax=Actinocorallia sp. API 0066 TaxID=2896846 RepID=UPI001E52EE63|nr:sporulation protein [Actinocorallia sp. API 0066]MCD0448579.1 sporulation protein [Actinocorallia sp. API 0066]
MIFKRVLGSLGIGGPTVDTVLHTPSCVPGGALRGEVRVQAADYDVEFQRISLGLVTRMEVEHGDGEAVGDVEFFKVDVSGGFRLKAGQSTAVPFELAVPWETPVTAVYGTPLHGMSMGVRTELAVAAGVDKGDLDAFAVTPLPSQEAVLDAFGALGFRFKGADVEHGRLHGVDQRLPFYQEIEFYPPPQYQGTINEVELTFVADPWNLTVVLEADKRGGLFSEGHDAFGRFTVAHADAAHTDWTAQIASWLDAVGSHGSHGSHGGYGAQGGHFAPPHQPHYGHHDPHGHGQHGHGDHGHHGGGGPGWGGVAAGVAGGMVAGYVAGEVFDEVFGDDEDSED